MRFGKVEVTGGFLLIVAWLNYLDQYMIVPLALLACFLHECGHYYAIRWLQNDIRLIRLTAVGAEMVLEHAMGYWQEAMTALAGPAVNLFLAALFARWEKGELFAGINLILGVFNLIPIGVLDGGRILHCILTNIFGPDFASCTMERINIFLSILMATFGCLLFGIGGNCTLLITAVWMFTRFFQGKERVRACLKGRKRVE